MTDPSPRSGSGVLYLYRQLWAQAYGKRRMLVGSMALLVAAQCILLGVP